MGIVFFSVVACFLTWESLILLVPIYMGLVHCLLATLMGYAHATLSEKLVPLRVLISN
ncbi:hypothetical protein BT63DRAFT_137108 [Microthyrium microscopicum]|uniref:Uncharacterized protein n=1 Tax=Microthyrium microscopicum TaxID=703497 RepID=A0A6A6UKM9_9PEZI|nr:hypothetical protein BT63DRAFT_137108 [Microthyrium microscopicum]